VPSSTEGLALRPSCAGRGQPSPEERAALEAYSEDLDRRMLEMIERYRKLNAEKHAPRGEM
jgi:hypothetical protein